VRRLGLAVLVLVVAAAGLATGQEAGAPVQQGLASEMTAGELQEELSRREEDLRRYTERLRHLEADAAVVQTELDARAAAVHEQEGLVRARLVTLCRLRQGGYLHLLRGARSVSDLMRRARYARAVAEHDLASLRDHQGRVADLERRRAELAAQRTAQRQLREQIAAYRDELARQSEQAAEAAEVEGASGWASPGTSFDGAAAEASWIDS
jgi:septal ring factor EnvC (AmiA/AmiB activator)